MLKNVYLLLVILLSPIILFAQADIKVTINGAEISSGATLEFGTVMSQSSIPNVLFIENVGDEDLSFNPTSLVSVTGDYAAVFDFDDVEESSISPGASLALLFEMSSSSVGAKSAQITLITDDLDESEFIINASVNVVGHANCTGPSMDMELLSKSGTIVTEGFVEGSPIDVTYYSAPSGWQASNSFIQAITAATYIGISASTDAYSGNSAIQLSSNLEIEADILTIYNCDAAPSMFTGFYKYSGVAERGYVVISTAGNDDNNKTLTNTDTLKFVEASAYTSFSLSIPYDEQSESSVSIQFVVESGSGTSTLLVDELYVGSGEPMAPNPLTVSDVTNSSFIIQWEEPNDNGSTITGYVLEEKVGSGEYVQIYSGTELAFSKTDASIGETYTYRVKATNDNGDSPYSAELETTPSNVIVMADGEVTGCDLVFTDTGGEDGDYSNDEFFEYTFTPANQGEKVKVSFSSLDVDDFEFFFVYDGADRNAPFIRSLHGKSAPLDVIATSETGQLTFLFESNFMETGSGWLADVTCITPSAPDVPTSLRVASQTSSSVIIEWDESNHNGSPVTAYTLQMKSSTAGAYSEVYSGTDLSYEATGLSIGETYYFRLLATNALGSSDFSEPLDFEVALVMSDALVTTCGATFYDSGRDGNYSNDEDFTLTIQPNEIGKLISISFESYDTEGFADYLKIYNGPDVQSTQLANLNGSSLPADFTSSSVNGELTFRFTSDDSVIKPGWVASIACVTPGAPDKPDDVTFSEIGSGSVVVNWVAPEDNGNDIDSYILEMKSSVDGEFVEVYSGNSLSHTVTKLDNGSTYYFRLRADNSAGYSLYSNTSSVLIHQDILMSDETVYTCAATFYDSGEDGDYSNDEDLTLTVKPTTPGKLVKISFEEFDVEEGFDFLRIYNGPFVSGAPQENLHGTSLPSDYISSSSGGELTFKFTSDDGFTESGWKATLSCVLGASTTWDGTSWSNGVPSTSLNAIIDGDYSGEGFTCANLIVNSGVSLTFTGTLEVKGDLTNDGTFTVTSGNSLITYEIGDVADNIVIERNTRYADGKYSFVGTPVKSNSEITGSDLGNHVYRYDEGASSDPNSLSRWIGASSEVLVSGQGYTQASQQLISFIGEPNSGEIIYGGLYENDGWHLVSNPYPAALSIDEFLAENAVTTDAIYIWDDNGSDQGRGSNSDYIIANLSGATDSNGPDNESRWNGNIGAMQGFMMQLDGTSGEIVFKESMRVAGNNSDDNFFRRSSVDCPKVRVNLSHSEGLFKQTLIAWNEGVTDDALAEGFDAKVFYMNPAYGISTMKAQTPLAIQTITSKRESIPLAYSVEMAGDYVIQLDHSEAQGYELLLADHLSGQVVDARYGYTFSTESGHFTDRFELVRSLKVLGAFEKQLQIYAAEHTVYFELPDDREREFSVFSLSGQLMLKTKLDRSAQIQMAIPSGVYLITDGEKSFKVVLK